MCNKIIAALTVIIAVILAILAIALNPSQLKPIILISRFFEVMIPVLGVGALLRYLAYCPHMHTTNIIVSACFLFVALVLGILSVVMPTPDIEFVILISRFFEVMLPIFAVGALVKFLISHPKKA